MKRKLKNKNLLMLSYFTNTFGFSLFVPLFATYVVFLGQNPQRASFLWAIYTFAFGFLILAFGKLEDIAGKRAYRNYVVFGYFLRLVATVIFIVGGSSFTHFAAGLILYGIGSAVLTPPWMSLFAKQSKNHPTSNWAMSEGGGAIFSASGAALGGLLFAKGGYVLIFYCMIGMHVIGLVSSILLDEKR